MAVARAAPAALIALGLASCGGADEGLPGGPSSERLTPRAVGFDGAPLGYLEYLPPGFGDGEPRPLLVYLHE